jgi:phosphate:Na+ symporter
MHRMYGMVQELFEEKDEERFEKTFERIRKYENISDNMEIEIAKYLEEVSNAHLSDDTKQKIRSMMRQISEIESIGDANYNLGRAINRLHGSGKPLPEDLSEKLHQMLALTDTSLVQMDHVLHSRREDVSIDETKRIEKDINAMRDKLKSENITSVNDHQYDYAMGTMFTDIVSECEKLGDYVVNVVEARLGK